MINLEPYIMEGWPLLNLLIILDAVSVTLRAIVSIVFNVKVNMSLIEGDYRSPVP